MESGIYKITINNDFYIGSATSLRQRKNRHL
nr:MAG TPA: GIY-YIG nuclease superfamily protein [Caudoviricetes sp.]